MAVGMFWRRRCCFRPPNPPLACLMALRTMCRRLLSPTRTPCLPRAPLVASHLHARTIFWAAVVVSHEWHWLGRGNTMTQNSCGAISMARVNPRDCSSKPTLRPAILLARPTTYPQNPTFRVIFFGCGAGAPAGWEAQREQ